MKDDQKKEITLTFNPVHVRRAIERRMQKDAALILKLGLLMGIINPEEEPRRRKGPDKD
jgi:hypothetical protein